MELIVTLTSVQIKGQDEWVTLVIPIQDGKFIPVQEEKVLKVDFHKQNNRMIHLPVKFILIEFFMKQVSSL